MIKRFVHIATLLWAASGLASAATTFAFNPSSTFVPYGQSFSVDVFVTGAVDLYAWQLDVFFTPPGIVNATSVTEGPFLGAGTVFGSGTIDNASGSITNIFNTLTGLSGVSGDGVLAHLSFTANSLGIAVFHYANVIALDSNLDNISDFAVVDGTVDVTPEPATFGLLGLSLAAGVFLRRRK